METLQELIGNRLLLDGYLRERAARDYDAMTPQQRRTAYIHQARVIHEISYKLASDGHTMFRSDTDLLKQIEALAWSTDGSRQPPSLKENTANL